MLDLACLALFTPVPNGHRQIRPLLAGPCLPCLSRSALLVRAVTGPTSPALPNPCPAVVLYAQRNPATPALPWKSLTRRGPPYPTWPGNAVPALPRLILPGLALLYYAGPAMPTKPDPKRPGLTESGFTRPSLPCSYTAKPVAPSLAAPCLPNRTLTGCAMPGLPYRTAHDCSAPSLAC